ncbi:MAG: ribonuclease III [Holosporales bacterium]|jgi:ribonuclease-3|nr:ribonuclease III [Holosporales bacterium]
MNRKESSINEFDDLENKLAYEFLDKRLLDQALRHSSLKRGITAFERLEFLGDRVLGLVVSEYIFNNYNNNEGEMSRMQSVFVCAKSCYEISLHVGIDKFIKTAGQNLKTNKTVLADAMESVLGAIFMDGGYEAAKIVILRLWETIFNSYDAMILEPKTVLQELTQAQNGAIPEYTVIGSEGPSHAPVFSVSVTANGQTATASGESRKIAETNAARKILAVLSQSIPSHQKN